MATGRETERPLGERVASLENWRRDTYESFRELEKWQKHVSPFLEQLQADLIYRQRRRAEEANRWSLAAKLIATITALIVCGSSLSSFIFLVVERHP